MQNWNISKRLMFLCACFMANIILVQAVGRWNVSQLSQASKKLTETELPAVRYVGLIDRMHDGLRAVAYRALSVAELNDEKGKKEVRDELAEFSKNIDEYLTKLEGLDVGPEIKILVNEARPAMEAYVAEAQLVVKYALGENRREAVLELEKFQKTFEALEEKLGAFGGKVDAEVAHYDAQTEKIVHWADILGIIIFLFSMGLGVFNGWFSIRDINKSMRDVVSRLRTQSSHVSETAEHVSQTSADLSSASVRQAEALQQTSSAVEEMSAMIKRTAENATHSREVASQSQDSASRGKRTVEEMISAIQEINQSNEAIGRQTDESNRQISEIVKVINEIGAKTKVINDIVFQTKLLSFNASVEAARAGEHGKGFAVVAEEVGNLAQMSGNASKEISDMLGASISRVEQIVNRTKSEIERLMNQNKSKVDAGARVASQCGEVFDEMYRSVSAVSERINEISTATTEQSHGINEITKAMNSLDQVTHANSASSQQAAAASGELKMQAQGLVTAIMKLEHLAGANDENVVLTTPSTSDFGPLKTEPMFRPTLKAFGHSAPDWSSSAESAKVPGRKLG